MMHTLEETQNGLERFLKEAASLSFDEYVSSMGYVAEAVEYLKMAESSYSQLSKALFGKENAAITDIVDVLNQLKLLDAQNARMQQTALSFAYQILTDKRNENRYSMTQIRNMDTMECFSYYDMLDSIKELYAGVRKRLLILEKEVSNESDHL